MKTAIVTGALGMDGMYLSCHLLRMGYKVLGVVRRTVNRDSYRLSILTGNKNFTEIYGDISDAASMATIVHDWQPDEFYHLAANSYVGCSWSSPGQVIDTNTIGTVNCLEAIRLHKPDCKFYFASSSETFGDSLKRTGGDLLTIDSPMIPASPYGVSKLAGFHLTKIYRESYGMFSACGVLFNHSSLLRGKEFFTRKVTHQLARIKAKKQNYIELGNLSAVRDEGDSKYYVRMMHAILQQDSPSDYLIASGKVFSCEDWLHRSLSYFGLPTCVVEINTNLFRPNEVNILKADISKAKALLPIDDISIDPEKMCEYDWLLLNNEDAAHEMLMKDLYEI